MIDPRGTISLLPMLRMFVAFGGGIFLGDALNGYVLPIEWIGAALISCILGIFVLRSKVTSSILVFLTIFYLGAAYISFQESQEPTLPQGQRQYEGVVISEPIQRGKAIRCDIVVSRGYKGVQRVTGGYKVKASLFQVPGSKCQKLHVGTTIRWTGTLESPREWKVGSHFSYVRWMHIHGYAATAFIGKDKVEMTDIDMSGMSSWEMLKLRFLILRSDLLHKIRQSGISMESFGVIAAMAMGDKTYLSKDEKDTYSIAGASHILALSGMHIGIIMFLLTVIVGGRKRRWLQILAIATVWLYVVFVGLPVSALRAALMLTIWYILTILRREQHPLNVLGATALILLLANPETIFDVGFQMSFMSVFFILLCMPGLMDIEACNNKVWRWLYSLICISCVAQLGTMPLTMYYFGRLSCYFLLTNIIIIPLATVLIYLTILLVIAILTGHGVSFISCIEDYTMALMNTSVEYISTLPGACIENLNINTIQLVALYVITLCFVTLMYQLVLKYIKKQVFSA